MEKINWIEKIIEALKNYPYFDGDGKVWADGNRIFCETEDIADAIDDVLSALYYMTQGEKVATDIGYYDPEVDKRNNEVDRYTGWWYVELL